MDKRFKQRLLQTDRVETFLVELRGERTLQQVADLLRPHLGTCGDTAVLNWEKGRRRLSSPVQLAYVDAFALDADLALHLQRLAGALHSIAMAV